MARDEAILEERANELAVLQILAFTVWWIVLSVGTIWVVVLASLLIIASKTFWTARFNWFALTLCWPVLALLALGMGRAAITGVDDVWAFIRDFAYLAKVPLIVAASLALMDRNVSQRQFMVSICAAAVVLAGLYVVQYFVVDDGGGMSRRALRVGIGRGYAICLFGTVVAAFSGLFLGVRSWGGRAAMLGISLFLVFAVLLSTSRTLFVVMALFGLVLATRNWRLGWNRLVVSALVFVGLMSLPPIFVAVGTQVEGSWIAKGLPGAMEMLRGRFSSMGEIQSGFRAYEAIAAWQLMAGQRIGDQFFGMGQGTLVPLGVGVTLGLTAQTQEVMTAVPMTHVALMTAYVKTGALGAGLYLFAHWQLLYRGAVPRDADAVLVFHRLAVMFLIYVSWTFQGFYANLDVLMVSLGLCAASYAMVCRHRDRTQ